MKTFGGNGAGKELFRYVKRDTRGIARKEIVLGSCWGSVLVAAIVSVAGLNWDRVHAILADVCGVVELLTHLRL